MAKPMNIRIVLAEDHPLFRDALEALIDGLAGLEVVATTSTIEGLLSQVRTHQPHVAVVDLGLADGSALSALAQLGDIAPECRVLVLTSADDDAAVYASLRGGAHGYLLKSASPADIAQAIRTVARGDGLFDGSVVERITRHLATGGRASATTVFPQLSPREHDILAMVAGGFSNAQIADHYVLSLKTVRNHVSNILTKTGAASRSEAIVLARDAGLPASPRHSP
jgi:DNA-binding NarL/FixJ family response regulator